MTFRLFSTVPSTGCRCPTTVVTKTRRGFLSHVFVTQFGRMRLNLHERRDSYGTEGGHARFLVVCLEVGRSSVQWPVPEQNSREEHSSPQA